MTNGRQPIEVSRLGAESLPRTVEQIPQITPAELIEQFEVILLDAFGVLVNKEESLPGAAEFIAELRGQQKPFFILSNDASKQPEMAASRYQGLGLDLEVGHIISSGMLLKEYYNQHSLEGSRTAVIGPQGSQHYVRQAGGEVVEIGPDMDVDVIALCDLHHESLDGRPSDLQEVADTILSVILRRLEEDAPIRLVLANPDLIYPSGRNTFAHAAGSIAVLLEHSIAARFPDHPSGTFDKLGKPYQPAFQYAERRSGTRNMVMVGDQLTTDIKGAHDFGIPSVLITTNNPGIMRQIELRAIRPTFLMQGFA